MWGIQLAIFSIVTHGGWSGIGSVGKWSLCTVQYRAVQWGANSRGNGKWESRWNLVKFPRQTFPSAFILDRFDWCSQLPEIFLEEGEVHAIRGLFAPPVVKSLWILEYHQRVMLAQMILSPHKVNLLMLKVSVGCKFAYLNVVLFTFIYLLYVCILLCTFVQTCKMSWACRALLVYIFRPGVKCYPWFFFFFLFL